MAPQVVDDPVARQRYAFRRVGEGGRDVLEVEIWVEPGGDAPPHLHPCHEERFQVIEGEMTFTVGRKKHRARPGERAVVPAGTRHAFRNPGDTTARMRVEVEPPMEQQALLEDFAALGRLGYLGRLGPLRYPKGRRGLLQVALVTRHYRDNGTLVVLSPPLPVQRLLLDPLARVAERRGHSAAGSTRRPPAPARPR